LQVARAQHQAINVAGCILAGCLHDGNAVLYCAVLHCAVSLLIILINNYYLHCHCRYHTVIVVTVTAVFAVMYTVKQGTVKQGVEIVHSYATINNATSTAKHDAHGHKQQM